MNTLLIVMPVFLIFFVGWLGQKLIGFDVRSISQAALYLMSPFLAFRTFYSQKLSMDYLYIFLFAAVLCVTLILATLMIGKLIKANRQQLAAMLLGGAFMNSGNYGAPVVLFALGSVAFDFAVVMMVFQSFLMNSVGIFIAALGGHEASSVKDSLKRVVRMPVLYGALLGVLLQLLAVKLPESMMGGISLIADASIPTVMLVLGMQLAAMQRKRVSYRFVTAVTGIRMFLSPLIAGIILFFLPISNLIKVVLFIQAAMPSAANTTLLALQFRTEPDLVSFTTFVTTLISLLTIPVLLFFVGV